MLGGEPDLTRHRRQDVWYEIAAVSGLMLELSVVVQWLYNGSELTHTHTHTLKYSNDRKVKDESSHRLSCCCILDETSKPLPGWEHETLVVF